MGRNLRGRLGTAMKHGVGRHEACLLVRRRMARAVGSHEGDVVDADGP